MNFKNWNLSLNSKILIHIYLLESDSGCESLSSDNSIRCLGECIVLDRISLTKNMSYYRVCTFTWSHRVNNEHWDGYYIWWQYDIALVLVIHPFMGIGIITRDGRLSKSISYKYQRIHLFYYNTWYTRIDSAVIAKKSNNC